MNEDMALNAKLAAALGWTNIEPYTYWLDDEEGAQEVTALRGERPGWYHRIPNYANSLDAVWAAIAGTPDASLSVDIRGSRPYAWINFYSSNKLYEGEGDTVTEAAARALEVWALDASKDGAHG